MGTLCQVLTQAGPVLALSDRWMSHLAWDKLQASRSDLECPRSNTKTPNTVIAFCQSPSKLRGSPSWPWSLTPGVFRQNCQASTFSVCLERKQRDEGHTHPYSEELDCPTAQILPALWAVMREGGGPTAPLFPTPVCSVWSLRSSGGFCFNQGVRAPQPSSSPLCFQFISESDVTSLLS